MHFYAAKIKYRNLNKSCKLIPKKICSGEEMLYVIAGYLQNYRGTQEKCKQLKKD